MENINNEIWRPIEGYEGLYEVSNTEKVRSVEIGGVGIGKGNYRKGNVIKPMITNKVRCCLSKNGKTKKIMLHIIVAKAFPEICGEWFEGCHVHHKDHNPLNNKPQNLICLSKEDHLKEHYKDKIVWAKNSFKGKHHTEETKEKLKIANSKPIIQYTIQGEIVSEWQSVTECERKTGYDKAAINRCCLGKQKTSYGYIWKHKEAS